MRHALRAHVRPARLRELVAALDEDEAPAAATWWHVGETAVNTGLPRPSYPHVRRLVPANAAAGTHASSRRRQRSCGHRRRWPRPELRLHARPAPRRAGRAGRRGGLCFRNTRRFRLARRRPRLAEKLGGIAAFGERCPQLVTVSLIAHRERQLDLGLADREPIPSRWCSTETTFARSSATSCSSLISSPGRSPSRVRTTRKRPACVSPWRITWINSVGSMLPPERTRRPRRHRPPCPRAGRRPTPHRRPRRAASSAPGGARSRD